MTTLIANELDTDENAKIRDGAVFDETTKVVLETLILLSLSWDVAHSRLAHGGPKKTRLIGS